MSRSKSKHMPKHASDLIDMFDKSGFTPLQDSIYVVFNEVKKFSPGGLHLPEASQRKEMCGWIVAASEKFQAHNGTYFEIPVKTGDKVYLRRYGEEKLFLTDKKNGYERVQVDVLRASDVIAVVNPDSEIIIEAPDQI